VDPPRRIDKGPGHRLDTLGAGWFLLPVQQAATRTQRRAPMRTIEPPEPASPWALPAGAEASPSQSAPTARRRRRVLPAIAPADVAATVLWVVIVLVAGERLFARLR
jgi:hypothetical protein